MLRAYLGYLALVRSTVSIAVLTDVHGNGFAAQAVAADIRRHTPDFVVNLGNQGHSFQQK